MHLCTRSRSRRNPRGAWDYYTLVATIPADQAFQLCRGGLDFLPLIRMGGIRWIDEHADHGDPREQLAGDLDLLSWQAFDLAQNAGQTLPPGRA